MALNSSTSGCVYPGNNAKTVYQVNNTNGGDVYTVPGGRILYVSDSQCLKIKYAGSNLPTDHRGGLTTDYNHAPFWATSGTTLQATCDGGIIIGIEIDA